MTLSHSIVAFFGDAKFSAIAILIGVDFILGIAAAVKVGTLRFSYLADFLRNDVLQKVLPWSTLYIGAKLGDTSVLGLDLGKTADLVWAAMVIAIAASILSSLRELGYAATGTLTAGTLLGKENAAPPKD